MTGVLKPNLHLFFTAWTGTDLQVIPWVNLRIAYVSGPQRAQVRISRYRVRISLNGSETLWHATECSQWYTNTHIHYIHTPTCIHIHIPIYIHVYIYTHIHTYRHIPTHTYNITQPHTIKLTQPHTTHTFKHTYPTVQTTTHKHKHAYTLITYLTHPHNYPYI